MDALPELIQGLVGVVPQSHRELRGRRYDTRDPDDRNDAGQYVDHLGCACAGINRGIGLRSVGRNGTTDRGQGCQPHQRQRPGIQRTVWLRGVPLIALVPSSAKEFVEKVFVVDGKTAQNLDVVQGLRHPSVPMTADEVTTMLSGAPHVSRDLFSTQ